MAGLIQSDKNISGDLTKAKIVSRKKAWRDLDLNLTTHPIRKDIIPLRDDDAIKNAVKNLLHTNAFERPFQPHLGANLRGILFQPADALTRIALRDNISRVLAQHEQRIQVLNIRILDDSDANAYRVTLHYRIKAFNQDGNVEIILRRLR
jgi:phage baseplate assembly protein W